MHQKINGYSAENIGGKRMRREKNEYLSDDWKHWTKRREAQ
jgi:hypothetical protein